MSILQTPLGKINVITPENWMPDRFILLSKEALDEACRKAEIAFLADHAPSDEIRALIEKNQHLFTGAWITPDPPQFDH